MSAPKMSRQQRLQSAADLVGRCQREKISAAIVIAELVRVHQARFRPSPSTNLLRVAGVQATCTWSEGDGLLDAWRKNATLKLMQMAGTAGAERERVS